MIVLILTLLNVSMSSSQAQLSQLFQSLKKLEIRLFYSLEQTLILLNSLPQLPTME